LAPRPVHAPSATWTRRRSPALFLTLLLAALVHLVPARVVAAGDPLKDLVITVDEDRDPVRAGITLRYRVICKNTGSEPLGPFKVKATYDKHLTYTYATTAPDEGTTDVWSVSGLDPGASTTLVVRLAVPLELATGTRLRSQFSIVVGEGMPLADYELTTVRGGSEVAP